MRNSPDPTSHRQAEKQFIEHVERLLSDDRLRIDTKRGRRPVTGLIRTIVRSDRGVDLKRTMSEMNLPDRQLESSMPTGEMIEVTLSQRKFLIFRQTVGRLQVVCTSPSKTLLEGNAPAPLSNKDLHKILQQLPPSVHGTPTTVVILSTSGYELQAHELAERRADRTLVLVEPNAAGGWSVHGPPETKALTDLFDPEIEEAKRRRVREIIDAGRAELIASGISVEKIVARTQLPQQLVESELRTYAKEHPGLTAKRLDGRLVLFREGAMPSAAAAKSAAAGAASSVGGLAMPFLDRMKSLFSLKGETEKKIAFLSERRTALSQQRDHSYEDMGALESREGELRQQFKDATAAITKRRLTSQILQLRKDLERRQQLLAVLNQQINVVSTHLHNLELVQQGKSAQLPDSDTLTEDAEKAEEVLAQLQADNELAGSISGIGATGMTDEEQALYEELEGGATGTTQVQLDNLPPEEEIERAAQKQKPASPQQGQQARDRNRAQPEAG